MNAHTDSPLPRVLFVDDEPGVRAAFARNMGLKGFRVDLAADGIEAMSMAARHAYPVVATDLGMPGLDGFSMIERLSAVLPGTVFVVVTGQCLTAASPVRTYGDAITRIVSKPWDSDDLADAIRRAFEIHRSRRTSQLPPAKVLLVESDEAAQATVTTVIERFSGQRYAVETVRSVTEAEEILGDHLFQAVLTEVDLPDAQGSDVLRRLQVAAPDTPIVVLTRHDALMAPADAIRLGAQDFIVKRDVATVSLERGLQFAIERKRAERRLAHLADHDQLTGLPSRALFQQRLTQAMTRAKRRDESLAVVQIDINRFKSINEALGSDGGDAVLVEVTRRLQAIEEATDSVARLGADEFGFIYEGSPTPSACARVAQQVLETLREVVVLDQAEITITASIGIALYPDNGTSAAVLVTAAETALMQAKADGRDSYRLVGDRMQTDALTQLRLESQLRRALDLEEFRLHYQPQFDLETGKLVGVEALVRWQKGGQLVSPAMFIPALEDTGLIVPVGKWVLEAAARDLAAMHQQYGPIRMAVNLSARQFEREGLVDVVFSAADRAGVPYSCMELEITESLLMRDIARTVATLASLKNGGVRVAIDDFGTGYSSLAYLRRFPVDVLKVDRMFVNEMCTSGGPSLAKAVIQLGHTLGLEVVAEGVETAEQLALLRANHCDSVQGFFCGRPVPFDGRQTWEPLAVPSVPSPPDADLPFAVLQQHR